MFPGVTNNHYSYLLWCGVGITQYVFNRLNDVIRWFPIYTCLTAPLQAISNQSRKGGINARVLETSEVREQGKMGGIADGWGRDDLTLWKPNSTVKFLCYTTPRAQHRRFLRNQPLYLCLTDLDGTHVIGLVAYYQAPYVRNIGRRHARGARGGATRSRVVLVCSKWRACSQVSGRL